jgi:hypothetical protein
METIYELKRLMELAEEALYEAELEAMSEPRPRWPVHRGGGAGDPFLHALIAIRAKILDALNARPPETVNLLILLCQTKILASDHVGKYNVIC